MSSILIVNDGPRIVSTNYWSTEHARRGLAYLSINAGAVRVLLPPPLVEEIVGAAQTADYVILSRGPWPAGGGRDALELLLEDHSTNPYALRLDTRQADPEELWPAKDDGRELPLTLWVPGATAREVRQVMQRPCRLRRVPSIPWLRPWTEG